MSNGLPSEVVRLKTNPWGSRLGFTERRTAVPSAEKAFRKVSVFSGVEKVSFNGSEGLGLELSPSLPVEGGFIGLSGVIGVLGSTRSNGAAWGCFSFPDSRNTSEGGSAGIT